jgi:hypothetical protein
MSLIDKLNKYFPAIKCLNKLEECPFKICIMVCLYQFRLGGPVDRHHDEYGMHNTILHNVYYELYDWTWEIKYDYIKLPQTEEEIHHFHALYAVMGPKVLFESVASRTCNILHMSKLFCGASHDKTISKFDKALRELVDGRYMVKWFNLFDEDGNELCEIGYYYLCDSGYTKFKQLIPPFKWYEVGTPHNVWSEAVESEQKDVERIF